MLFETYTKRKERAGLEREASFHLPWHGDFLRILINFQIASKVNKIVHLSTNHHRQKQTCVLLVCRNLCGRYDLTNKCLYQPHEFQRNPPRRPHLQQLPRLFYFPPIEWYPRNSSLPGRGFRALQNALTPIQTTDENDRFCARAISQTSGSSLKTWPKIQPIKI